MSSGPEPQQQKTLVPNVPVTPLQATMKPMPNTARPNISTAQQGATPTMPGMNQQAALSLIRRGGYG